MTDSSVPGPAAPRAAPGGTGGGLLLSSEDQASLERIHRALQADPEGGFTSALRLLRNTGKPAEALDHLVKIAGPAAEDSVRQALLRLETAVIMPTGSFWEARPVQAMEDLFALAGFHLIKVQILLEAVASADRSLLPIVRNRIAQEQNERVIASMVTYLGHLGDKSDAGVLAQKLSHKDGRVVANALEAMCELDAPEPEEELRAKLEGHESYRVRAAVLAHLGRADLASVLPQIRSMALSLEPDARAAAAYVCGELGHAGQCRQILLEMLTNERDPEVLSRLARSVLESIRPKNAASLIGPLHALSRSVENESAAGDLSAREKATILFELRQKIAVSLGWTARQMEDVGEKYMAARDSDRGT